MLPLLATLTIILMEQSVKSAIYILLTAIGRAQSVVTASDLQRDRVMRFWYQLTLLTWIVLVVAAHAAKAASVMPEPLPVDEASPTWDGAQIVSAARGGHVFFFRGDTFDVYPVTKAGSFGKPTRLETTAAPSQMVHDAVLSSNGNLWLVYGDLGVRLFVDGKEKVVPPIPWKPWSVTLLRDEPVVAVLP